LHGERPVSFVVAAEVGGAIVVFMTWLWLSIAVILVGAEIDAEMEHQTARNTTTGGGKPNSSTRSQDGGYSRASARIVFSRA
jgi:membrane protein